MVRLGPLVYHALVLAVLVSTQGLLMTQAAFTLRRDYIAERQQERQTMLLELALSVTLLRPDGIVLPVAPIGEASAWPVDEQGVLPEGTQQRVFHPPRVG